MTYRLSLIANRQKLTCSLIISCWLSINLLGCATVIEGAKGFAGISTKILEDKRSEAISQTFNCDYNLCYDKTTEILNRIGAYTYAKDLGKNLIAVYISETDTTPVGLFFKKIDANNTQIEVSSPSTYGKEYIADKVFPKLMASFAPAQKETKEQKEKTEEEQTKKPAQVKEEGQK